MITIYVNFTLNIANLFTKCFYGNDSNNFNFINRSIFNINNYYNLNNNILDIANRICDPTW